METAHGSEANQRYNDESLFLDGIIENHPQVLQSLSVEEREALVTYYALDGVTTPEDESIFDYRTRLVHDRPDIQRYAEVAFKKVLHSLGIDHFNYST